MKLAYFSEFFEPFIRGGAEVSSGLIIKRLIKEHEAIVYTQKHRSTSWKIHGISVHPIFSNFSAQLDSPHSIIKYLLVELPINPWINMIKAYFLFYKSKTQIVEIDCTNICVVPIILGVLFANKKVVLDLHGGALLCATDFSRSYCYGKDFHTHRCFKSINSDMGVWPKKYEMFRIVFALYKYSIFMLFRSVFWLFRNHTNLYYFAISKYTQVQYLYFGIKKSKITVIYNPLTDYRYKNSKIRLKRILYSGRVESSKGVWDMVEAFIKIKQSRNYTLLIIGDGGDKEKLKKYIRINHYNNIKLADRMSQPQLLKIMSKSKILIAPSVYPEPFGRFIHDSIVTNTPLISTTVGGIPEAITTNYNGILVPPNDPENLTKALDKLLNDKEFYEYIYENIKLSIRKYNVNDIVNKRVALYKTILQ